MDKNKFMNISDTLTIRNPAGIMKFIQRSMPIELGIGTNWILGYS
jgi:hypothetical protein